MKHAILFTFILLTCSTSLFAQTDKGSYLVGGSAGMNVTSENERARFSLRFFPNLGIFIIDDLAIGASLPISLSTSENFSSTSIGLSPFIRYYFYELDDAKLFGYANVGVRSWSTKNNGIQQSQTGTQGGVGAGIALFLRETVGLEAGIDFQRRAWSISPTQTEIGLWLGFQIYLDSLSKS